MQGRHKKGFIDPNVPNKQDLANYLQEERSRDDLKAKFNITWSTLRGLMDSYSEDLRIYEYQAKRTDGRDTIIYGILRA